MFLATSLNTGGGTRELLHLLWVVLWVIFKSIENYLFYPKLRKLLGLNIMAFVFFLYYLFYILAKEKDKYELKREPTEQDKQRLKMFRRICIISEYLPILLFMNYPMVQMMLDIYNRKDERVLYHGHFLKLKKFLMRSSNTAINKDELYAPNASRKSTFSATPSFDSEDISSIEKWLIRLVMIPEVLLDCYFVGGQIAIQEIDVMH